MGKVFLNKKFSDYLGEQRALLDIVVRFVPDVSPSPPVSPTPTPSVTASPIPSTPTPTASLTPIPPTPTPSVTQTATSTTLPITPSPTPTNPRLCTSFVATAQTINGITITQSWTGTATPYTFSPQFCCGGSILPPSDGMYCGYGGSAICPPPIYPFDLTFDFTSGVNDVDIVIYGGGCAGGLNEEIFNFTTDAGIPTLSIIGSSCYTSITGNTVGQGIGCCAGINDTPFVRVRVNAPSNFTELVITGDGGYRGAVIGLCSDSIPFPTTPTQTPSNSPTPSVTPVAVTPTPSVTQTATSTPILPTSTPTNTSTPSPTPPLPDCSWSGTTSLWENNTNQWGVCSNLPTPTPSVTPSNTPTISITPSNTASQTPQPTSTPTNTPTPSSSPVGGNYLLYETGDIMEAENGDLIEYDF